MRIHCDRALHLLAVPTSLPSSVRLLSPRIGTEAGIVNGRYFDNSRIASSSPLMVKGYMRWFMICCTTLML